ncbi:MAG: GNAT family N-acetyltransferase [Cyclobacteriaceae bacterium]
MDIKQIEHGSKGAFVIDDGFERLAEMTYSKSGEKIIIIDHTDVSDKLRGQGAGKQLVVKAVEYARINHIKILQLCPFARSVFDKSPELSDVLNT